MITVYETKWQECLPLHKGVRTCAYITPKIHEKLVKIAKRKVKPAALARL